MPARKAIPLAVVGAALAAKLAARTERQANGCLIWTGPTDHKGYGRIWHGTRT